MELFVVDVLPPHCGLEVHSQDDEHGPHSVRFRAFEDRCLRHAMFRRKVYGYTGWYHVDRGMDPIELYWGHLVELEPSLDDEEFELYPGQAEYRRGLRGLIIGAVVGGVFAQAVTWTQHLGRAGVVGVIAEVSLGFLGGYLGAQVGLAFARTDEREEDNDT